MQLILTPAPKVMVILKEISFNCESPADEVRRGYIFAKYDRLSPYFIANVHSMMDLCVNILLYMSILDGYRATGDVYESRALACILPYFKGKVKAGAGKGYMQANTGLPVERSHVGGFRSKNSANDKLQQA